MLKSGKRRRERQKNEKGHRWKVRRERRQRSQRPRLPQPTTHDPGHRSPLRFTSTAPVSLQARR